MLARNDQNVRRRLRTDVVESKTNIVFVNARRRNFTGNNFTKKTIFTHNEMIIKSQTPVMNKEIAAGGNKKSLDCSTSIKAQNSTMPFVVKAFNGDKNMPNRHFLYTTNFFKCNNFFR
jgi:hypothetical protein